MSESIRCPSCGSAIPLTEVIEHQVDEQLRLRIKAELDRAEAEHAGALREREVALRQEFAVEQELREQELQDRTAEKVATELADLRAQVEEQDTALQKAREQELELRREKRQLAEERASLELELARRLDEQRTEIEAQTAQRLQDEHRLKLAEKDVQIEQMTRQIKDLQESSEQMRSGLRGEVLERDIEDILRERFPVDLIEPIKAGVRGADVLQIVRTPSGRECGSILWESKRSKTWSNGWIAKLKEDQAEKKADIAIIAVTNLPQGIEAMDWREGVWVVDAGCVGAIAIALREGLLQLERERAIDANRDEARDAIYAYLCGREFRQRIIAIGEAFVEMQNDLQAEKRAITRIWAKREKQHERIACNTAGIYGDLQGIMGGALAPVELLELPPAA